MKKFTAVLCGLLLSMQSSILRGDDYPRGELLVSPSQLSRDSRRSQAPTTVLDVRPKADYDAGHVPGAQWLNVGEWSKSFDDGRDGQAWTKRIADLGISNDSTVVVYDDGSSKDAARVWWLLRYWGVKNAKLLNGGFTAWSAAKLPVDKQSPEAPSPSDFKAQAEINRLATKQSILASIKSSGDLQIVDARSEGEYCGTEPGANKRAGAIPSAKNLEWSELIDPSTKQFKSADELRALFEQAGIDLDRPTAAHCQSGGRSSVMAFGMELMGADHVANYYRSWAEWGNAPDTPIEPGKPKKKS